MKKLILIAVVSIAIAYAATAADSIVQIGEQIFTNATITSDGVRVKVMSSSGIETFPLSRMNHDDQVRWGYKPAAAAAQAKQDAVADVALHESFAKQKAAMDAANAQQSSQVAAAVAAKAAAETPTVNKPVKLRSGAAGAGYDNLQNAVNVASPF